MKISRDIARTIVREISNTIHQNVNFMDDTGHIIASTDPVRIGTYHVGAQKIIEERLDYLKINTDEEYNGTKVGINMPVYLKGEIVGVLGISGEWSQIEKYINLIRKTTETLLMNYYLQKREAAVQKERKQYLHNLLYEKIERLPEDFVSSGELLGVDLSIPRRCLCISFVEKQEMNVGGISTLLEKLEQILPKIQGYSELCLAYREKNQLILFLPVEKDVDVGKFISRNPIVCRADNYVWCGRIDSRRIRTRRGKNYIGSGWKCDE